MTKNLNSKIKYVFTLHAICIYSYDNNGNLNLLTGCDDTFGGATFEYASKRFFTSITVYDSLCKWKYEMWPRHTMM